MPLNNRVAATIRCDLCPLHENAFNIRIDGRGDVDDVQLMFIGEAPGREDDKRGMPFVGPTGQLLDMILKEAGVPAKGNSFLGVHWTNTVRCIPRKDNDQHWKGVRATTNAEWANCAPYIFEDIDRFKPKMLVIMGGSSAEKLLGHTESIVKARERLWTLDVYGQTYPAIVTFHPAYVLRGKSTARADIVRDVRDAWQRVTGKLVLGVYRPQLHVLNNTAKALALFEVIKALHKDSRLPHQCVSFDVETTSHSPKRVAFDPWDDDLDLAGFSLSYSDDEGFYVPLHHAETKVDIPKVIAGLGDMLRQVPITAHQAKFDGNWAWSKLGVKPLVKHCTLMLSHTVHGEKRGHSLRDLGIDLLGAEDWEVGVKRSLKELKTKDYGDIPLDVLGPYGAMDAVVGHALMEPLLKDLDGLELRTAYDRGMRLTRDFMDIEYRGCFADTEMMTRLTDEYPARRDAILERIRANPMVQRFENEILGWKGVKKPKKVPFNPGSDQQLASVLYYRHAGNPVHDDEKLQRKTEKNGAPLPIDFPRVWERDSRKPVGFQRIMKGAVKEVLFTDFYGYCLPIRDYTDSGAASTQEVDLILTARDMDAGIREILGLPDSKSTDKETKQESLKWRIKDVVQMGRSAYEIYLDVPSKYLLALRLKWYCEVLNFLMDIREWKKIDKLITGYIATIPTFFRNDARCRQFQEHEGLSILNTRYLIEGTRTGRVSTREYSFHTTPKKSDPTRLFVSRWWNSGGLVLAMDFSQLELRVLAAASRDEGLIGAYMRGEDIHAFVAAMVFNKDLDKVTDAERTYAKTIDFGIIYGRSAKAMSEELGIPVEESERHMRIFMERFPGVKTYMDARKEEAKEHGYVRYPTGRIRWIINPTHPDGERQAGNAPIQGAASEMVSDVLMATQDKFRGSGMDTRVWGWIHDSIECDIAPGELFASYQKLHHTVNVDVHTLHPWFDVPCEGGFEIGSRWGTACEVSSFEEIEPGTWKLTVEGKIPFVDELIIFMKRGYEVHDAVAIHEREDKLQEELILRQSYEGDSGGTRLKKMEVVFSCLNSSSLVASGS